jgi:3D (Asp-Asp-Asp) domain-containing protein
MPNLIIWNRKTHIFSKKKAASIAFHSVLAATLWLAIAPHAALAASDLPQPTVAPIFVDGAMPRFPQAALGAPRRVVTMAVSAYTSEVAQTDASPCTTASGLNVCERNAEDIVATNYNYLPFGTAIRIPELFGDRIFYVHDRMNKRYTATVDVWMKDIAEARQLGRKTTKVEIF